MDRAGMRGWGDPGRRSFSKGWDWIEGRGRRRALANALRMVQAPAWGQAGDGLGGVVVTGGKGGYRKRFSTITDIHPSCSNQSHQPHPISPSLPHRQGGRCVRTRKVALSEQSSGGLRTSRDKEGKRFNKIKIKKEPATPTCLPGVNTKDKGSRIVTTICSRGARAAGETKGPACVVLCCGTGLGGDDGEEGAWW